MRFDKGEAPLVSAFWNLSMYDENGFFIENDFKRYSIGSTTDGLTTEPDGSITLLHPARRQGPDRRPNWLPAPADSFNLTMRLYGPQAPILDGSRRLLAINPVT